MSLFTVIRMPTPSILVVLCSCLVMQSGCGGLVIGMATYGNRSVAHKKDLWGGYQKDEIYSLNVDMFVMRGNGLPNRLALELSKSDSNRFPNGMRLQTGPDTVEAYHSKPDEWPIVRGLTNAGTRVQVTDLRQAGSAIFGKGIYVYAEILDGQFKGKTVDLGDISLHVGDQGEYLLWGPDSRLLTRTRAVSE